MPTTISGNGTSSFGGGMTVGGTTAVTGDVSATGNMAAAGDITEGSPAVSVWRTQVNAAQATTSGTFIDLPAVPSWVKRITIPLNGVSTNGANNFLVQVGAGSIAASGYDSSAEFGGTGVTATNGFVIRNNGAANTHSGHLILTLNGSNVWVASGIVRPNSTGTSGTSTGNIALGGTLDRVRLTTVGGTDAFDAGSISSIYEG